MRLSDAIAGYLIARTADGYSPHTLAIYRHHLGQMADYLGAPDLDAITPDVLGPIRAADDAVLDGTFFRRRELARGDADVVPHPAIADSMNELAALDTRITFTHLNHTNPAADPDSKEARAIAALGMRVAREGDRFELG